MNKQLLSTAFLLILGWTSATVVADTIAVIGTGHVAGALGPQFASQGHIVVYGSRAPDRDSVKELVERTPGKASATTQAAAAAPADIIVLAVRWAVAEKVVRGLGSLSGKIVIDPINPYRRTDAGLSEHIVDTSAGEMIQAWLPDAFVVKAFNTLSYTVMADPGSAGGPVSIPLVGDNAAAKAKVARLVEGMGLEAVDLGPIRYAHEVEGMLLLWMNARLAGHPIDFHLRAQPRR